MRAPSFWHEGQGGLMAVLLSPLGWIYEAITLKRLEKPGWRAEIPVLCVGNFTAGGGGKTPTSRALATCLIDAGETPIVLSRGYGGRLKGPVLVDTAIHKAQDVGDEPLLLAKTLPVIVAKDRVTGAKLAIQSGASVIVLDDGMQSPALSKDFTLAVIDAGFGLGNGRVIPAGPLRVRVEAMAGRFDAVLKIGAGRPDLPPLAQPVYESAMVMDGAIKARLSGAPCVAFAGIARPEKFAQSLMDAGIVLEQLIPFADHHAFTDADATRLLALIDAGKILVTTEKDHVRLNGSQALDRLNAETIMVPVSLPLPTELVTQIQECLGAWRNRVKTASGLA